MVGKLRLASLALAGAVVLGAGTANAAVVYDISSGAIPLSNLVGTGSSLLVGDKIFDNFTYSTTGADMPTAANVNVTGEIVTINNQTMWGFELSGGFQDTNTSGSSDALLHYNVHVVDPALALITSAYIQGNPDVIGSGKMQVTETFLPSVGGTKIRVFNIDDTTVQMQDQIAFDVPVASLSVQKDILASIPTGVAGNAASLSFVDQLYTQGVGTGVPEPASIGVLALGALGLLARRRK